MTVDGSVKELKGVGDKNAALLAKLGIRSIHDLLEYYPRAYTVFALPVNISELKEGTTDAIECVVSVKPEMLRLQRFTVINLRVNDPSGSIKLTWFNTPFVTSQIRVGSRLIFRGRIVRKRGELFMAQPKIF